MELDKKDLVSIREFLPSDYNFIFATWLRGLYHGDSWYSQIPKKIFMEQYHAILEALLGSSNVKINVACLKDDQEVILAYAVISKDETKLHWVFCKNAWRNIGLARSIVPKSVTTATNLTKVGLSILKNHSGVEFNPFAMI